MIISTYPVLYDPKETEFDSMGLGSLSDYEDWNVIEERNGPFEFEMVYPTTGIHYPEIQLRSIITAKPDPYRDPQPFRVYEITKPINGRVKIYGKHLSYDLNGIPVEPFTATNSSGAAVLMNNSSLVANPFTMYTDVAVTANMSFDTPQPYRSLLGGQEGSILDVYGGEYEFDCFDIHLWNRRGEDKSDDIVLRYGKNISDIEQVESVENAYTGIIGYWVNREIDDETGVEETKCIRSDIIYLSEDPEYIRVYLQDFTDVFPDEPSVSELNEVSTNYAKEFGINIPDLSVSVKYEQDPEVIEEVKLCDIIRIEFEKIGVSTKAKVVKTIYNGPRNRFTSIDIGDVRSTFGSTLYESISTSLSETKIDMILQAREIIKRLQDTEKGIELTISANDGRMSDIEATYEDIKASVADLQNGLSYILTPTEASWEFTNTAVSQFNEQNTYITNAINDLGAYIRFSQEQNNPYIILGWHGGSDSLTKLKIFSDKMLFFNGDDSVANINGSDSNGNVIATVFAYFTNSELTAETLRVGGQGNLNTYVFTRRENGHLTLRLA